MKIRSMSKRTREHAKLLADSIKAADDLEKLIEDEVAGGTMKPGTRDYNDAKKVLKGLRESIGLAQKRRK